MSELAIPTRSIQWRWYICGLLFMATTINYLDRQTLSVTAKRIQSEFQLNDEQYGKLEFAFGIAFAIGGFTFGFLADKFGVYWIYPAVLLLWSLMGVLTGFVENYEQLMLCRTFLGFFESGHWPCALKTTQRILSRQDRGFGNSLLQGGTSIGAVTIPLLMNALLTDEPGSWRGPFMSIGFVGMFWIFFWFASIRPRDFLAPPPEDKTPTKPGEIKSSVDPGGSRTFWQLVLTPRYFVLVVMVVAVNVCWHTFRVWLPKYLQFEGGHAYSEVFANRFVSIFYCVTEAGCIASGMAMLMLPKWGLSVHRSRVLVFAFCTLLTTFTTVAAILPTGLAFLGALLVVGFGSLGLFPPYYSFAQEISHKHHGKVAGLLTFFAWVVPAMIHPYFGAYIDRTKSYSLGIAIVGWAPLVALVALVVLWSWRQPSLAPINVSTMPESPPLKPAADKV